jgi:competence protein ComEC
MKKLFSLLIVAVFFVSFIPKADAANDFKDVTMYSEEISYLTDLEIIKGYEGNLFKPEAPIKRLQAVQMILREMGISDFSGAPNPNFTDMKPGQYGYDEVAKAVEIGFIGGKTAKDGSKYFDPWGTLTRGQMAKILVEAYDLEGTYHKNFKDVPNDHWAKDFISSLAANNITTGYADNSFKPENKLQRQHFAVFMARQLNDAFKPAQFEAHFINVGQGDSTLLMTPNGKSVLIDGGKRSAGEDVVSYLRNEGITSLDLVVATHPDADHIGGLIDVLEQFNVEKVLDSGQTHTSQTYMDYLNLIDQKNIPFQVASVGELLDLDPSVDFQVLNSGEGHSENNEASIVLKVSHGEIDFMLTGDATTDVEVEMISQFNVEAEILKIGHHGSNTSTSDEFVNAVDPEVGILSYGENSYGHPESEVVNRMWDAGATLYSTCDHGSITVESNGASYYVDADPFMGGDSCGSDVIVDPDPVIEDVYISDVDLSQETVTVMNGSNATVDISGWYLISEEGNQRYDFPPGSTLEAGYYITVWSGPDAQNIPPYYQLWTNGYIWNNSGDAALLYNSQGELIDEVR